VQLILSYAFCTLVVSGRGVRFKKKGVGVSDGPIYLYGSDLQFPHHDNELAQAEAYFHNHEVWVPLTHHLQLTMFVVASASNVDGKLAN
jgi:hypothetical protein